LRGWTRAAEVDAGTRPGITSDMAAELRRLREENAELRRANEILKTASAFFRGGARPPTALICAYIDRYKSRFGVEPICRVLTEKVDYRIAPSTYYASKTRQPSRRARDDAVLLELVRVVHEENYSCYGVVKM
jgi:hypothetical protein